MARYRRRRTPFKSYLDLARHLTRLKRLELPRPDACARCGTNCGFTRDGHYFRSFVFLDGAAERVGVQRYECRQTKNATFSALAAFQEPGAHYAVAVPGEILDRVFVGGQTIQTAWQSVRRRRSARTLARSTATRWCRRFHGRAASIAGAVRAQVAQRLPGEIARASSDPGAVIQLARASSRLHRRWPRWRFWEWLHGMLRSAARRPLLGAANSRTGRYQRPHVVVMAVGSLVRLRLRPRKEQPHERSRPKGAGGAVLAPRDRAAPGPGS